MPPFGTPLGCMIKIPRRLLLLYLRSRGGRIGRSVKFCKTMLGFSREKSLTNYRWTTYESSSIFGRSFVIFTLIMAPNMTLIGSTRLSPTTRRTPPTWHNFCEQHAPRWKEQFGRHGTPEGDLFIYCFFGYPK